MSDPLVSVTIPVYNGERFLAEAIESVLAQSWTTLELIVVDDGSTDASAEIAASFGSRLSLHRQPNGGLAAARNAGVRLATGAFLAHLDADDLWMPDSLARRMAAFTADPALDMVFGHVEQFYSPETDEDFRRRVRCPEGPMASHQAVSMLVRREAFDRVGFYNPTWRVGSDMEWFTRASDLGLRMTTLPEIVFRRRIHERNMGIVNRDLGRQRLHILKAALDRRRAAARQPGTPEE